MNILQLEYDFHFIIDIILEQKKFKYFGLVKNSF